MLLNHIYPILLDLKTGNNQKYKKYEDLIEG
jgi:hypothetical protein